MNLPVGVLILLVTLALSGAACGGPTSARGTLAEAADGRLKPVSHLSRGASRESRPAVTHETIDRAAFEIVDLSNRRRIAAHRPARLLIPVLPGSLMKPVAIAAALDAGIITAGTRLVCPGRLRVAGRTLDCVHPAFHGGLTAVEALAHSCNGFVAAIAPRVGRDRLTRAMLVAGLPPVPPGVDVTLAALGLDGARLFPRDLVVALARLAHTHPTIAAGLRECARTGTASALARAGRSSLAKTATTTGGPGGASGLVVVLEPAEQPSQGLVLLAPGGAGRDAAEVASEVLARHSEASPVATTILRVGRLVHGRVSVQSVAIEEYVADVLAAEAPPNAPPHLLDALAIVVRTYAQANRTRHAREGFDLCDLTHCQAMRPATGSSRRAAAATAGRVLRWRDRTADVFYTASCGGHLESPDALWPPAGRWAPATYLSARPDPVAHPTDEWTAEVRADALVVALRHAGLRGDRLLGLSVRTRTGSGRAGTVSVDGFEPGTITGDRLRLAVGRTLGWQFLKSALFKIERTPAGYRFRGRGRGHGVGMCLAGATTLARSGASSSSILDAYFPGTTSLNSIASSGTSHPARAATRVRLVLPTAEEGRRGELSRIVRSAIDVVSRNARTPLPETLTIRVHPSVASYQRATGQPWWTAGATAVPAGTIDLIPLDACERVRRDLPALIRHEVAHVIADPALRRAPRWVREGVASWLAGEPVPPPRPSTARARPPCPGDGAFARAGSAERLAAAYAEARVCVDAALATGADWRTLR